MVDLVFRPGIDVGGDGKAPDRSKPKKGGGRKDKGGGRGRGGGQGPAPSKKPGRCDLVEATGPIPSEDIQELEKALARAERRLMRARARVEQVESDLLLADDPDDKEDLNAELAASRDRKDAAMSEWKRAKGQLAAARARAEAEALAEKEVGKEATPDEVAAVASDDAGGRRSNRRRTPGVGMGDIVQEDMDVEPMEIEALDVGDDEDLLDYLEEKEKADLLDGAGNGVQRARGRKGFWTARRAIVVGVVLFLILPVLLYGFVIPRVDVTVRTWYYEGFQNSIVIDTKVKNDGTVDVKDLELNISLIKVVDGVEVFLEELAFDDPTIYRMSEQKVDCIVIKEDQTADYMLLVQISFSAGNKYIDRSYTHNIDKPYMNIYFDDNVFQWAF